MFSYVHYSFSTFDWLCFSWAILLMCIAIWGLFSSVPTTCGRAADSRWRIHAAVHKQCIEPTQLGILRVPHPTLRDPDIPSLRICRRLIGELQWDEWEQEEAQTGGHLFRPLGWAVEGDRVDSCSGAAAIHRSEQTQLRIAPQETHAAT